MSGGPEQLEPSSTHRSCIASQSLQIAQVAEHLYDVLASRTIGSRRVPVLLAANKADCGAKAHSVEFIRKRLEKALDQLCMTRAEVDAEGGEGKVPWGSAFLHVWL